MTTPVQTVTAKETVGLSPKVALPSAIIFVVGVILIVLSVILGGDNTLLTLGLAAVGASGVTLGAGYQAPPGDVTVPVPAANAVPGIAAGPSTSVGRAAP